MIYRDLAKMLKMIMDRKDLQITTPDIPAQELWNGDIAFMIAANQGTHTIWNSLSQLYIDLLIQLHIRRIGKGANQELLVYVEQLLEIVMKYPMLEQGPTNKVSTWDSGSFNDFMQLLMHQSDGLVTFFHMEVVKMLHEWYVLPPNLPPLRVEDLLPYITLKQSPRDTSTSTMLAPSQALTADAPGSIESPASSETEEIPKMEEESDEELKLDLDEKSFTAKKSRQYTGETFCSISHKQGEKYYTWKSEARPTYQKLIDIRVYEDLKKLKKESNPKNIWRHATFRAKLAIGNPSNPKQGKETKALLKNLIQQIVKEAKEFPKVKAEVHNFNADQYQKN